MPCKCETHATRVAKADKEAREHPGAPCRRTERRLCCRGDTHTSACNANACQTTIPPLSSCG
eukprot:5852390-Alexandrium_andersonii.AAC.1